MSRNKILLFSADTSELKINLSVTISPNPLLRTFTVESTEEINNVKILNIFGTEVFNENYKDSSDIVIDLGSKPAGTYIAVINDNTYKLVLKNE